jgi:phage tail sheath protein FI
VYAFEPNDFGLMARIERDVTAALTDLFYRGALKGKTPDEAFYVKCDEETNPPIAARRARLLLRLIAPGIPSEFILLRIVHDATGVTVGGSGTEPTSRS